MAGAARPDQRTWRATAAAPRRRELTMHEATLLPQINGDGAPPAAGARRRSVIAMPPSLPLAVWLLPALALPLVELAVDVGLGGMVAVSSPVCAVLRGLMGERLRELRCLTGATNCRGCTAAAACEYARVFDGDAPHPFWLQGVPAAARLAPGTRFTARLYAAAPAHATVPYLDVALRDALRRLDPRAVIAPPRVRTATLGVLASFGVADASPLRLRTETPLALHGDEELCRSLCPQAPWFALLVRAGVRRLDTLVRAFAEPAVERQPRADLPDLTSVEIRRGTVALWSSSRFSHRQRQRLALSGLRGDIVLAGPPVTAVAPLLRALTVTSVGKATALGLGTLRVEAALDLVATIDGV